jgi:ABC-type glycerol-3-phosphate transport system permease component
MEKNHKKKLQIGIFFAIIGTILSIYTISMIAPLLWGLSTALKDHSEFIENVVGLPKGAPWNWKWSNFINVVDGFFCQITTEEGRFYVRFPAMFINTMVYAIGSAIIQTIVPCIVGYMTAKFDYKFSRLINTMVIVLMVLPIVGSAPSELQILKSLGLFDTMIGNFIQKFNFLGMYYLIFYAAFKNMPNDFMEAGYVDGASEFRVMVQIALPMVATVMGTVVLIKFIEFWNDYQTPLLYLPSYATLARGLFNLSQLKQGDFATVPFRTAGCMLFAIPVFVLFIIFKEKLMGNISMGGVKE